ncbi:MAG: sugar phosphate isomerase/epimerase [Hyphomicrobiaceae bacterium]
MRQNLILNAQTLARVPFDQRVRAAAAAGYRGLSIRPLEYRDAHAAGIDDRQMLKLLAAADIEVTEIGFAATWLGNGRFGIDEDEDTLWHMAELFRPRQLNAGLWEAHDPVEVARAFAVLCDRAAERGLLVALEFIPHSGIRTLAAASQIIARANRANGGLILDAWHLERTGEPYSAIAEVPADRWLTLQLADAATVPWFEVREESRHGRLLPGEGTVDFPALLATLRRIGASPLVSVEVISDEVHRLPPQEGAKVTLDSAVEILNQCGLEPGWWRDGQQRNAENRETSV